VTLSPPFDVRRSGGFAVVRTASLTFERVRRTPNDSVSHPNVSVSLANGSARPPNGRVAAR